MKPLVLHLDPHTLAALNRLSHHNPRKRDEFLTRAIRIAVREAEFAAMREAYRKQPDSASDADDWPSADAYNL